MVQLYNFFSQLLFLIKFFLKNLTYFHFFLNSFFPPPPHSLVHRSIITPNWFGCLHLLSVHDVMLGSIGSMFFTATSFYLWKCQAHALLKLISCQELDSLFGYMFWQQSHCISNQCFNVINFEYGTFNSYHIDDCIPTLNMSATIL